MAIDPGGQPPYGGQPADRPAAGGSSGRMPGLVSGLALFLALVALVVSLFSLSRTGEEGATTVAAATPTSAPPTLTDDPTPTDSMPTDSTATTDPSVEPTSEPTDGPDPGGVYTAAYQREQLRLQPSANRYIDLDEPSGNSTSTAAEFTYSGYDGQWSLHFRELALAEVRSPTATANDCALQLRRAPIDDNFAPSKGQRVCVLTSAEAAGSQGIRQKIVLMQVDSIGANGVLNLTLTAWTVPR
jgi:hypothetical protein